jgi:hypothetical protein
MTQFRLERGEGGVACRCGLATATGVDAQLASIDAAPPPPGATSWRELTTRNADRLLA